MKVNPLTYAIAASAIILAVITTGEAIAKSYTIYQPRDLHVALKGAVRDISTKPEVIHVAVNPGYYSRPVLVMSQIKQAWPNSTHMKVTRKTGYKLYVKFLINAKANAFPKHLEIVEQGRTH